jgi:predicted acylesterase/phospholipase RssA
MAEKKKTKRRGFVMTGGGAKGLYEAGVIHAFHISGMEFDVITGSSIGAMNSAFYAEYQLRKKKARSERSLDPDQAIEAMDDLVKAYHHAWLSMPERQIIDDRAQSPLGLLVDDLTKFNIDISDLVQLYWWYTSPEKGAIPSPKTWPALMRIFNELVERLGSASEVLRIVKDNRKNFLDETIRTYLRRFDLENSVIPAGDDRAIQEVFTQPISPLQAKHLTDSLSADDDQNVQKYPLVDPVSTFQDYANEGIDVRLTRANYRTGRLEISTYLSKQDFMRYMEKQAWRLAVSDPEKMPLGSFRLQIPGNPNVINAALASGRFPGVFAPYKFTDIYPQQDDENSFLYTFLNSWLEDADVQKQLVNQYQGAHAEDSEAQANAQNLINRWKDSSSVRSFFPKISDSYVDGGSIDNTPSNSAIDATREWIDKNNLSKRDVSLDLFVVFLHPEPKIDQDLVENPALYQIVARTLEIQGAATQTSDAVVVDAINSFGARGEILGRSLIALLNGNKEILDNLSPEARRALEDAIQKNARELGIRGYLGDDSSGILDRMATWTQETIDKLPLHVDEIKIYPEKMPLSTLQFTERLGYRQDNALEMLTMGCYNTLWALRLHLEDQSSSMDDFDIQVLGRLKKWMGFDDFPKKDLEQQEKLQLSWKCQRTACVFYAQYCQHGLQGK